MRYFLDTEFIDDGKTIDLISIGIVCEDGRELYLQSCEFNPHNASSWVEEHVLPHLSVCHQITRPDFDGTPKIAPILRAHKLGRCLTRPRDENDCPWRTRKQIMYEVGNFFQPDNEHTPFELVGWCSAYDYVALCQLFGTMMDIPAGWPHYMRDLQHALDDLDISDDQLPKQTGTLHNALEDARHIKRLWEFILSLEIAEAGA